jgi:hypothetical protein
MAVRQCWPADSGCASVSVPVVMTLDEEIC